MELLRLFDAEIGGVEYLVVPAAQTIFRMVVFVGAVDFNAEGDHFAAGPVDLDDRAHYRALCISDPQCQAQQS
jgi:hypothetical protein